MSALAHPLRRRMLDALGADGPATVGQLAERTGQAVGSVSHHLKALAAAGLVHEAPELARNRRERWWCRVPTLTWRGPAGSAAEQAALEAATDVAFSRQIELFNAFRAKSDLLPEWSNAAFALDTWLQLTSAELEDLGAELATVLRRWRERDVPDDGAERRSAFVFTRGFPARP